jgi:hypothetical protein
MGFLDQPPALRGRDLRAGDSFPPLLDERGGHGRASLSQSCIAISTPSAILRGRSPIPRTSAAGPLGSTSMTFVPSQRAAKILLDRFGQPAQLSSRVPDWLNRARTRVSLARLLFLRLEPRVHLAVGRGERGEAASET